MKIKVEENAYGFGVRLTSGCDEYIGAKLIAHGLKWRVTVSLPQWLLRPATSWRDLSRQVGTEGYAWLKPRDDGRYGYTEVFERAYGFSYYSRAMHVYYGKQTMEWPGSKSKCFFLPWLEWRHVRHSLLNLDGSMWADATRQKFDGTERLQESQPSESFQFADYDGEVITAKCRVEEREWRAGIGWFKWLSLFRKPKISRSLDLAFSSEVGRRKGSWKGGTIGHSIEIAQGESPRAAFARYCAMHDLSPYPEAEPTAKADSTF